MTENVLIEFFSTRVGQRIIEALENIAAQTPKNKKSVPPVIELTPALKQYLIYKSTHEPIKYYIQLLDDLITAVGLDKPLKAL